MGVSITCRRLRAEAMIEIGKIFQAEAGEHKKKHKNEKLDARRHMEEAFIRYDYHATNSSCTCTCLFFLAAYVC